MNGMRMRGASYRIHAYIQVLAILHTVHNKTFEGENICGFGGFSLTVNVVPLKIFLLCNYICDCLSKNPPSLHLPVFREIPF